MCSRSTVQSILKRASDKIFVAVLVVFVSPGTCSQVSETLNSLVREYYDVESGLGARLLDKDTAYNEIGGYAWYYAYFLEAELLAYEATRDTMFLSHFVRVADIMLSHRDHFRNVADWTGVTGPGWRTTRSWNPRLRKNVNNGPPRRDLVEDANITYPYLRFGEIVMQDSLRLSGFLSKARHYVREGEAVMDYHIKTDWYPKWQRFVFPKGSPIWADGINVPNNYEARVGSGLLILYKLTGNPVYERIVSSIAGHIRADLTLVEEAYVWHYWSGRGMAGWLPKDSLCTNTPVGYPQNGLEDISHGGIDVSFMIDCYDNHLVFDIKDMKRLVNSFQRYVNRPTYFAHDLSGNGNPHDREAYNPSMLGWMRLSRFDPSVWQTFVRVFYDANRASKDIGRLHLLASLLKCEATLN